ncbi:MAG: UbiA family prenyltransferase [Candidatus Micrarchaeota archaeon]
MFLKELWRLTRFEHALMLALAVLIAETIILGRFPPTEYYIVFSLLVPIFSEMGSFALNDYFDIETDRLNKKDRPLVRGTIAPSFALYFSVLSLAFSVLLAYMINSTAFIIALAFNLLAAAYNWKLKDLPLVGNAYIALTMAIPFIFGNFVVGTALSPIAVVLALLGFVAGLAREIIKTVQDMEGDIKARGSRTLPVLIGKKASLILASVLYLLFIPLSAAPFVIGLEFSVPGFVLVGIADCIIMAICIKLTKNDFRFARNASLAAFLLGMLGILVASL